MDLSVSVSDELSEAGHARTSLSPALTWQPRLLLVAPVISDCPPCVELEIKTVETVMKRHFIYPAV